MKTFLGLAIFAMIIAVRGLSVAAEADGFRGLSWGTELPSVAENMTLVRTDPSYGGVESYSRKDDELQIGAGKLTGIKYGFWQGQLAHVIVRFSGYSNFAGVRDATQARFGVTCQPNRYLDEYYWFGEITTMSIRYSSVSNRGTLNLNSNAISKKQKAHDAERAKKGAEKGF